MLSIHCHQSHIGMYALVICIITNFKFKKGFFLIDSIYFVERIQCGQESWMLFQLQGCPTFQECYEDGDAQNTSQDFCNNSIANNCLHAWSNFEILTP
jgi:hypothetical protein